MLVACSDKDTVFSSLAFISMVSGFILNKILFSTFIGSPVFFLNSHQSSAQIASRQNRQLSSSKMKNPVFFLSFVIPLRPLIKVAFVLIRRSDSECLLQSTLHHKVGWTGKLVPKNGKEVSVCQF